MSRFVRRKIFEDIHKVYGIHQWLFKEQAGGSREKISELLMECQDIAMSIGNRIEIVYGEKLQCIHSLEDYCELVYCSSETFDQFNVLDEKMHETEKQMDKEIPDTMEVVFLPYKAAMWDSLESVWLEADKDVCCDAFVIPIPYYVKNPDGSFKEEFWDGNEFPDYVPITRYEEYNFEVRHPDVIFIHNPYDNCNYVVSVRPFFYSNNLVQFTEQLVYIPYFVLNEKGLDNTESIEKIKPFIVTPVTVNAHKIIVQSENMRRIYIDLLTEITEEEGVGRDYWGKKILGLGSPKTDKVINTKIEDVMIPEEWKQIIYNQDGKCKKVIFYNTGVDTMIKKGEKLIKKIKEAFCIFKENKESIALLWRPHPMMKATIEAIHPGILKEYEEIVEEYCTEGWGIYDDSADLNRAIALSDAYYGDGSSVATLCRLRYPYVKSQWEIAPSVFIEKLLAVSKIKNNCESVKRVGKEIMQYIKNENMNIM